MLASRHDAPTLERTALHSREHVPVRIPDELNAIRSRDHPSYVRRLVSFLLTTVEACHPATGVGWWCCHEREMADTIEYLSQPVSSQGESWHLFREKVAVQVSCCRQCALTYHKAIDAWELSGDDSETSKRAKTVRLRSLVEWDAKRLIPSITRGAVRARLSDDPSTLSQRTQCREAFLESLSSLHLCMHRGFCEALGELFRTRSPARDREDIVPFVKSQGRIPPGLVALCFHSSKIVRGWAKSMFTCLRRNLSTDDQVVCRLIANELRYALEMCPATRTNRRATSCPRASDMSRVWEGLDLLVNTVLPKDLEDMAKRAKLFPFIDVFLSNLSYVCNTSGTESFPFLPFFFNTLCTLLQSVPFSSLFGTVSIRAVTLLDHILGCLDGHICNSQEKRLLLDALLYLACSSMRDRGSRVQSTELFVKCFEFLEHLERYPDNFTGSALKEGQIRTKSSANITREDVLSVGARLLNQFYSFSCPRLHLDEPKRVASFVIKVIREMPDRECSWDLLRNVLFVDIFSLLKCVYSPRDVEMMTNTFSSFQADVSDTRKKTALVLQNAVLEETESPSPMIWMEDLWDEFKKGFGLAYDIPASRKVRTLEINVLLDLHRIVGALDAKGCGSAFQNMTLEMLRSNRKNAPSAELVSQRIQTAQVVIQDRIRMISEDDKLGDHCALERLPFHAAHLLSSSNAGTAKTAHHLMEMRCKSHNGKFARTLSRDMVIAHTLGQNTDDKRMLVHGFISAMRIISAQGTALSARVCPSFFRWYCFLTSKKCRIIGGGEGAKEAAGVLLTFLERWREFEASADTDTFREVICKLFRLMPDILDSLGGNKGNMARPVGDDLVDVNIWTEKIILKLFTMYNMKEEVARRAWVNMVTHENFRQRLPQRGPHRDKAMDIIRFHGEGSGPLHFDQCRKLAVAYELEEANCVVKQLSDSVEERRYDQPTTGATARKYRDTSIRDFFPPTAGGSRPPERKTGGVPLSLNAIPFRDRFLKRAATLQQRQVGQWHNRPVRSNGALHDLRRNHRQERSDIRRIATRPGILSGNRQPSKTRFELLREERIAAKERKKAHDFIDEIPLKRAEICPNEVGPRIASQATANDSVKENFDCLIDEAEDVNANDFLYPEYHRHLESRSLEQIQRVVLSSTDPGELQKADYCSPVPAAFENVSSYVNYWEPLLVAEFRASIDKKREEERGFAKQNKRNGEYVACRTCFEADGPPEDIGYLQTLSITHRNRKMASSARGDMHRQRSSFDIFDVKVSDIVIVEISTVGHRELQSQGNNSGEVVAMVSNVTRKKEGLQLSLRVVFDNTAAPGKGRTLRVSKLMNFATLQRQLDALWSLPRVPDGILWSLMDPLEGWRLKREFETPEPEKLEDTCAAPLKVIQRMESLRVLNPSQRKAIIDVLQSCRYLFSSPERPFIGQTSKCGYGSFSLIQGPPGTGKTSTIVALLSALLSHLGACPYRRRARTTLDGTPHILSFPAVRVLVCAPSNAAVDELMLRVMEHGLLTASGFRFCPRLVRVGRGATIESLKQLEVHSLARRGAGRHSVSGKKASAHDQGHRKLFDDVNEQIKELDCNRKTLATQLGSLASTRSEADLPQRFTEELRDLNEKLTVLHDKKKLLHSAISDERAVRKKDETLKKREEMINIFNALASASVVFATLSSSGHEDMKAAGIKFDVVIIDEAGQSCEPDALIPLTLGQHIRSCKPQFTHTVLVGDPKQLPATVLSGNRHVRQALGRSLFERLGVGDPSAVHLLDTQYRMHPMISSFPSEQFYRGLLQNGPNVENRSMEHVWHGDTQKRFGPLTFFDTTNTTTRESRGSAGSLSNREEAMFVIKGLISLVRLHGISNIVDRVVVLSPYKRQVLVLQDLVAERAELKDVNVEVSTIDGIQGREKSIVLLSTVRSGHSSDIGFVRDERRMNVALTRAKHTLMIFGHASFLSSRSDAWAALVEHCRKRSQLVSLQMRRGSTFPEFQSGYFLKILKKPRLDSSGTELELRKHGVTPAGAANQVSRLARPTSDSKETAFQKVSQQTSRLKADGTRREPTTKEGTYSEIRKHLDSQEQCANSKARIQGPQGNDKCVETPLSLTKDGCQYPLQRGRVASEQVKPVYNRSVAGLQPPGHVHLTTCKEEDKVLRLNGRVSSFPGMKNSTLGKHLSAKRRHYDTARNAEGIILKEKPLAIPHLRRSSRRVTSSEEEFLAGFRTRRELNIFAMERKQPLPRVKSRSEDRVKSSSEDSHRHPRQAALPSLGKRNFQSLQFSEPHTHNAEEALYKKRREGGRFQQERAQKRLPPQVVRREEPKKFEALPSSRKRLQQNVPKKGSRQAQHRLISHHRDKMQHTRHQRGGIASGSSMGNASQIKRNTRTPGFSLSETQTKLRSTLDAAKQARGVYKR